MNAKELELKQKAINEKISQLAHDKGLSNEPICDGVTNCEAYCSEQNRPRIMWILKEPYDCFEDGEPRGGGWDITDVQKDPNFINNISNAQKRIIYSMECIRSHGKDYDDMDWYWDMPNHLTDIAYINLSKMPGFTSSGNMMDKFNIWRDIDELQIKTYDPDVIIMGNTFNCISQLDMFKDVVQIDDENGGMVDVYRTKDNKKLLPNAYHPSARVNRDDYIHSLATVIDKYFHL